MTKYMLSPWGEKFSVILRFDCERTLVGDRSLIEMIEAGWRFQ